MCINTIRTHHIELGTQATISMNNTHTHTPDRHIIQPSDGFKINKLMKNCSLWKFFVTKIEEKNFPSTYTILVWSYQFEILSPSGALSSVILWDRAYVTAFAAAIVAIQFFYSHRTKIVFKAHSLYRFFPVDADETVTAGDVAAINCFFLLNSPLN